MGLKWIVLVGSLFASSTTFAEDRIFNQLRARSEDVARATKAVDRAQSLVNQALRDNNLKVVDGDIVETYVQVSGATASTTYKTDQDWLCTVGTSIAVSLENAMYVIQCWDKDMKVKLDKTVHL